MNRIKKYYPLSNPEKVYLEYIVFVGETSDGNPEQDARIFAEEGGC